MEQLSLAANTSLLGGKYSITSGSYQTRASLGSAKTASDRISLLK